MLMLALVLSRHKEKTQLSFLKKHFLPGGYDPDDVLEKYSSAVNESFKNPGRLAKMNVDKLMQNITFKRWEAFHGSSLMLLYLRSNQEIPRARSPCHLPLLSLSGLHGVGHTCPHCFVRLGVSAT